MKNGVIVMNEAKVQEILDKVGLDAEYIQSIVDELVNQCCDRLDSYVEYVSGLMNDPNYELTSVQLDDIVMTIPTILYFVGTQQERYGIKRDVSKSSRTLMYNKIYADTAGTAGVKKAAADAELFNEEIVTIIFDSTYNTIKAKVDAATELLQSAKKVVSRRMSEIELTRSAPYKER